MIPALTDADCQSLGNRYSFSGGQIENVVRKYSINCILRGNSDNYLDILNDYCAAETLKSAGPRKLGFC